MVEAVVAAGVLGLVAMGIASVYAYSSSAVKTVERRESGTKLVEEIRSVLSDRNICSRNLANRPIALAPARTVIVDGLHYYDNHGTRTGEIITVGSERNGVSVTRIEVIPRTQVSATEIIGEIVVSLKGAALATAAIVRRIPILMTLQTGNIVSCITGFDSHIDLQEKSCYVGSDGRREWNADRQACEYTAPLVIVIGDHDTATCPPGHIVADVSSKCRAKYPDGYVDNRTSTRVYADGSVDTAPAYAADCPKLAPNKCACYYGTDIDSTGFLVQATCVQE